MNGLFYAKFAFLGGPTNVSFEDRDPVLVGVDDLDDGSFAKEETLQMTGSLSCFET